MKMNRISYLLAAIISICVFQSFAPGHVSAISASLGADLAYEWWQPAWNKRFWMMYGGQLGPLVQTPNPYTQIYSTKFGAPLYGPQLQIDFSSVVSCFAAFNYGVYIFQSDGIIRSRFTYRFYDSRLKLILNIHNNVGIIAALHYRRSDSKMKMKSIIPNDLNSTIFVRTSSAGDEYSPAVGLRITIPIIQGFRFTVDAAGSMLFGNELPGQSSMINGNGPQFGGYYAAKGKYTAYGMSLEPGLQYMISSIHTLFSLSFRYQLLHYAQKNKEISVLSYDTMSDHRYGIHFSVSYSFSVQPRKKIWIPHPDTQ